jgi:hypothetical protein
MATLVGVAIVGCSAADARAPRFPDPLPPHTKLAYAKSDDPNRPPTETPELWILSRGRVTYLQTFAHRNGLPPRVFDVKKAFERYLDNVC